MIFTTKARASSTSSVRTTVKFFFNCHAISYQSDQSCAVANIQQGFWENYDNDKSLYECFIEFLHTFDVLRKFWGKLENSYNAWVLRKSPLANRVVELFLVVPWLTATMELHLTMQLLNPSFLLIHQSRWDLVDLGKLLKPSYLGRHLQQRPSPIGRALPARCSWL